EGEEWEDFHLLFVAELRRQLTPRLRPKYLVRGEEYVYLLREPGAERGRIRPDTFVLEARPRQPGSPAPSGGVGVLEAPLSLPLPLAADDPDLILELQSVFDAVYDTGAYADALGYARPPSPPLPAGDAAWAAALLTDRQADLG